MRKIVNSIRNMYLGSVGSTMKQTNSGILNQMADSLDDDKEVQQQRQQHY